MMMRKGQVVAVVLFLVASTLLVTAVLGYMFHNMYGEIQRGPMYFFVILSAFVLTVTTMFFINVTREVVRIRELLEKIALAKEK